MKTKKRQHKKQHLNNPMLYFLDTHIEPSASLARVEASFDYAMSSINIAHKMLFDVYQIATHKYSTACVMVVPGENKGIDMIPYDFAYLQRLNEDESAKARYLDYGHNHIPCYLHSRNILKREESDRQYEFKLILVPYIEFK